MRITLPLFAVGLFTMAGCRAEEDITRSLVEHPDREEVRMRVGIIQTEKFEWFVKLSGPTVIVEKHKATFDDFLASVKFEDDKEPTWTEPKGWKKDPAGGGRVATFRSSDKPKEVEIAITKFPHPPKGFDLLGNVQRWQKQVNLPPAENEKDLEGVVQKLKGDVLLIDLVGRTIHTVSKPPDPLAANKKKVLPDFAIQAKKAGGGPGGPGGGGGKVPFRYTVPAGWVKRPPGQFAAEAYEIADKISVTLTPAAGDLGENINRWRGQVGLPSLKGDDLKKTIVELPVAGIKSAYVDLDNAKGPPDKNRTLGVIIPPGGDGATWFIKAMGPRELVGKHKAEFETFMKSFKLDK